MKQIGFLRQITYVSAGYVYSGCALAFSCLQWVGAQDIEDPRGLLKGRPFVTRLVEILQEFTVAFYILMAILALACFFARRMSDPWVLEKIKFILDEYQLRCFEQVAGDPADHHRVTLFRCESCLLNKHWSSKNFFRPWGKNPIFSGWFKFSSYLVPILRSGHMSQKSSALFYVCDDSEKVEGLAGLAWASSAPIIKVDLPDPTSVKKGSKRYLELINDYASKTKCDPEMIAGYLDRNRPLSRSIAAIPVMVNDRVWGVIVLDSRKPNGVSSNSVENYELTVAIIGQLLEKA